MQTKEIELFLAIDSDGDVYVDMDSAEDAAGNVGSHNRVFRLKLTVPLPQATELTATLPDTDGPLTLTVA